MTDQEFVQPRLPIISGSWSQVVRALAAWADRQGLPRHGDPDVEFVPFPAPVRWVWEDGCTSQVFLP